jgi:predicted metal-dependent peptidase
MAQPFFGALALRLKMKEDKTCKTLWTDGVWLGYNPDYVSKLTNEECKGVVAHEVMHPAMLHHLRKGNRQHGKWNKAADYAINNVLVNNHFALPKGALVNPAYNDMAAEAIYPLIPDNGDGGENGDDPDPGNCGEVREPDGGGDKEGDGKGRSLSESERKAHEAEWKIAVAQAAHVAKQAGKLPAGMERIIEDVLKPVLPWKNILRRFMTEKAMEDFTWAMPNRRFVGEHIFLPSRISEDSMGALAIIVDTSGSISNDILNDFGAEVQGVHREVKPKDLYVIYCDAEVNHVDHFGPDDTVTLTAHGGGGTDFRPPFEWMAENGVHPKCAVYLTDGYGMFPDEEDVPYPMMWALYHTDVQPPFGETLHIE